jgi:hypothetical protein
MVLGRYFEQGGERCRVRFNSMPYPLGDLQVISPGVLAAQKAADRGFSGVIVRAGL